MIELLKFSATSDGTFSLAANIWFLLSTTVIVVAVTMLFRWGRAFLLRSNFEIDQIELGVGSGKITIKPSHEDLQMAYMLWVELKTRKLGLPFDETHDVIEEVYNSWYEFFQLTRELIKSIPVSQIRSRKSTQQLVGLSINVLNRAIRPHLTKWQARFRHWHDYKLAEIASKDVSPQDLQKQFPEYAELVQELKNTNAHLVAYAKVLAAIVNLNPDEVMLGKKG